MAEFRVNLDNDGTVIDDKRDVTIQETANPFGDQAIIKIEDDGGTNYDKFDFGRRVEVDARKLQTDFEIANAEDLTVAETETFSVAETDTEQYRRISNKGTVENQGTVQSIDDDSRDSYSQRFSGFVVQRDDKKQSGGRDETEVTVYSFDQLLRADSVSNDQEGKLIVNALKDIIQTDTAVTWNASNVTVEDEQEITESLKGERVEDALLKLSTKSVNESFGVNDSIEFFFRETETQKAPNDISESNWIDYELPERGEENKNESRTFYDNGDRVAVVDDGVNQLELQESLGTDDPVILSEDRERGDLTNVDDAAENSEQNLRDKEVAKVYEFVSEAEDFLDAEPGNTLDVTINAAGIDDEFRIAAIEYNDRAATAELTCIRNKGNTDDVLRRVTERLRRKELENADFDGPQDRINISEVAVIIGNSATVDGQSWSQTRVTNTLRNQIRDGWGDQGNVDVADIAVGDDASNLSRTNDSLENETARKSVSETLNGSKGVSYDASFSQSGVKEIGLFDSAGNLLYRAVNDTGESPGTVDVSFTVSNDSDVPKAVVTDRGQESIRDIIADNSPTLPTQYGFGSDQTDPQTSDDSLGNSLFKADLTEFLLQDRETQSELSTLVGTVNDTDSVKVESGEIKPKQTVFTQEANSVDGVTGSLTINTSKSGASDSTVVTIDNEGGTVDYEFRVEKTIPAGEFTVYARTFKDGTGSTSLFNFFLDGDDLVGFTRSFDFINNDFEWTDAKNDVAGWDPPKIEPGTHTFTVELDTKNDPQRLDVIAPADSNTSVTLPGSLDGNTDYLAGPELYPTSATRQFDDKATTRRELDEGKAELSIDDTTGNQAISLSNDGGSTFNTVNNSSTASVTFNSKSREVISKVTLDRFGSRTTATPTTGFKPQSISRYKLFANPLAVVPDGLAVVTTESVVPSGEITGQTIAELGQLDSNDNTLTRSIRAELDVTSDMRVIGRERLTIRQS